MQIAAPGRAGARGFSRTKAHPVQSVPRAAADRASCMRFAALPQRAHGIPHARRPIPRRFGDGLHQIALRACDSRCRGWWARGDSHARRPIPCRACLELQQSMLRACGSLCRGGQTHGNSRTRSPVPHKASDRSRQIALQGCAPHRRGSRRRKRRWVAPLAAGVSWGGEQPARLAGATQDERDAESR